MKVISMLLLGAAILCGCSSVTGDNFKAENLTVGEFFENPVGRSLDDLSFSWKMPLVRDGAAQSAYRIVVSSGGKQVWDSGKVESSQSVKVPYAGSAIKPRTQYSWRVMIWDEKGNPSDWSDTATFESGLFNKSDWLGEWISTPESVRDLYTCLLPQKTGGKKLAPRKGVPPAYFRKTFDVKDGLVSARLYIATLGILEAYANGDKIGNEFWGTGWTQYDKRVTSDTFDITSMLKTGENTVGVILADGWYAGRIVNREGTSPKPELLAQIELKYADGSTLTIPTNATWKTTLGAYVYSDIYDGENFDARLAPKGWDENGFDASAWKDAAAKKISSNKILITPRRNQPIRVCQELKPISVKEISDGVFVFDFGQNMVGVPRISVKGDAGKPVKIRYAEMLEKDGTLYTANYRSALSTDYFTPASDGLETYQPKFTFHGFRYVELSGLAKGWKPTKDAVIGLVMHNDMPKTGAFECSNAKVNKLQSNIVWGQKSNYFSVPTDCPQRDERMGWTGDAQVFTPTAAFNMNVDGFFSKWCQDLVDTQTPDGAYTHVAPVGWGSGSPAWSDAGVICPWEIYLAYGDKKILAQNYAGMAKWIDFQKKTSKDLLRPDVGFGDWLQPSSTRGSTSKFWMGETPKSLIGTAYFARTADIMSKVAKILGKDADAEMYARLASDVRAAFNKAFVRPDGEVGTNTQTGYLLALAFDLLPENLRQKAFDKFLAKLEKDKWYLDTGFVGTPLLNPVLTKFGRMDIAYRMLLNEGYPSWLYPINQGATTMWERWNSYSHENGFGEASMNSFNHYAYGAIGEWMYRDIAGIWHDESAPGYKLIVFAPKPGGGLTYARAAYETPYGHASSFWSYDNDGALIWNVVVPANAEGLLVIPASDISKVSVNGEPAKSLKMRVKSGGYNVRIVK